ncbi:MAG: hypothetical protein Q8P91_00250 [bacterium]|nr:hypothetical protein [bacterium]
MSLTNGDLKAIGNLVGVVLDEKIEEKGLVTKDDIKYLPTKDELYAETTKILKKMDDLEVEKDLFLHRSSDHSDRIEALEKIHPTGKHFASA